jgi:hypothetical protein
MISDYLKRSALTSVAEDTEGVQEQTFPVLRGVFSWCWEGRPLRERITIPGPRSSPECYLRRFLYQRVLESNWWKC